jgi:hypothetical protein
MRDMSGSAIFTRFVGPAVSPCWPFAVRDPSARDQKDELACMWGEIIQNIGIEAMET